MGALGWLMNLDFAGGGTITAEPIIIVGAVRVGRPQPPVVVARRDVMSAVGSERLGAVLAGPGLGGAVTQIVTRTAATVQPGEHQ